MPCIGASLDRERPRADGRLFLGPGLMRDKRDVVHRADGATYRQMTIAKAAANCRETYSAPSTAKAHRADPQALSALIGCAAD